MCLHVPGAVLSALHTTVWRRTYYFTDGDEDGAETLKYLAWGLRTGSSWAGIEAPAVWLQIPGPWCFTILFLTHTQNQLWAHSSGEGAVSHLTCPQGIQIKCEYVEEAKSVGEGVSEPELSRFPATISRHLITSLLPLLPHPRPPPQQVSPCCAAASSSSHTLLPGSLPQTPAHFKDVSTL